MKIPVGNEQAMYYWGLYLGEKYRYSALVVQLDETVQKMHELEIRIRVQRIILREFHSTIHRMDDVIAELELGQCDNCLDLSVEGVRRTLTEQAKRIDALEKMVKRLLGKSPEEVERITLECFPELVYTR